MKISHKIITICLPMVILPLILLGLISFKSVENAVRDSVLNERANLLDQMCEGVLHSLHIAKANSLLFSHSGMLREYLHTEDKRKPSAVSISMLIARFQGFQKAYPEYFEFRLLCPTGVEECRQTLQPLPNTAIDKSGSAFFMALSSWQRDVYTTFYYNEDIGDMAFLVSRRLKSDATLQPEPPTAPEPAGYLLITITTTLMQETLQGLVPQTKGHVFFATADGKPISSE